MITDPREYLVAYEQLFNEKVWEPSDAEIAARARALAHEAARQAAREAPHRPLEVTRERL